LQYKIYRSVNEGEYEVLTNADYSLVGNGNEFIYVDSNIAIGNNYSYYVTANGGELTQESEPSKIVGAATTANLTITIEPNPVPYSDTAESWPFHMILTESGGIGVTLNSVEVEEYNQDGQIIYTNTWDVERINNWFGSNYIDAFSSIEFLETHGFC